MYKDIYVDMVLRLNLWLPVDTMAVLMLPQSLLWPLITNFGFSVKNHLESCNAIVINMC